MRDQIGRGKKNHLVQSPDPGTEQTLSGKKTYRGQEDMRLIPIARKISQDSFKKENSFF